MRTFKLSGLGHTWLLDLDGTIVKHNGYKLDGYDSLLEGARDFLNSIPDNDMVVFITSRMLEYKKITEDFLNDNNIRYNCIIYGVPHGERILVNDRKPSGLNTAIAFGLERNGVLDIRPEIDERL